MAKKKKAKHAHHGGAWKVAYADFVTAMMALFMVLWICAQDQEILISTSRYFQNPFDSPFDESSGVMSGQGAGGGADPSSELQQKGTVDMAFLHQLANELYRLLNVRDIKEEEKPIDIAVTSDGLRITVFDREKQPFFKQNTAEFTPWGNLVVQNLAWVMDQYNLGVRVDAYVGSTVKTGRKDYGPWELSADRGNAMRRGLVHYALDPEKIDRVTAFVINPPLPGQTVSDQESQRLELSLIVPNQ